VAGQGPSEHDLHTPAHIQVQPGALPRTCCEARTLRDASFPTLACRMGCVAHLRAGHALPGQLARACHAAPLTAQLRRLAGQVADFGCAHLAPAPGVEARQLRRGTLAYQPPELLEGGVGSTAADCYAFGVLLWEMLTAQARPHQPRCLALAALCSVLLVTRMFCGSLASHMGMHGLCSGVGAPCRQELHRRLAGTALVWHGEALRNILGSFRSARHAVPIALVTAEAAC